MIFKSALRRELSFTTGGVFLVLVTIMVTTLVIRILGYAANGTVNPEDAIVLIALATLGYLAVLLTVSLFVATLIVLVRWYKDSEMIVWFASGLSISNLIRPILQFATPLIIVIALLALFGLLWVVAPWGPVHALVLMLYKSMPLIVAFFFTSVVVALLELPPPINEHNPVALFNVPPPIKE